jgi:hypothetical protein
MLRYEVHSRWCPRALLHPWLLATCKIVALPMAGVYWSPVLHTHVRCQQACLPFAQHPCLCLTLNEHPPIHARATPDSLA